MNRILKRIAIISCVLLVCGIVCMVMGTGLGGQLNYAFNFKNHKVYVPTDEEMQYVDKTMDVEAFDSVDVELGNVDVEMRQGENYQVQYHLTSWDKPVIEVKDRKLVIRNEEDKTATFGWSFGIFGLQIGSPSQKEQKKMIVTIPENVKLENMKLNSEFGDINMSDLQMESCDIKADSGALSLDNIEAVNATILSEFGNVTVNNMTGEMNTITANSGDCGLDEVQSNQLNVTAEYGKVKLNEIKAEELVVDAASGDVLLANVSADIVDIVAEYGDVTMDVLNGDTCTIEAQSGKCELDTIHLVNLMLDAEYGNVNLSEIEVDKIVVDADSGNITCRDLIAKLSEWKAEYGNVSIENATINDVNIVCESGNCEVDLIGNVEEYDKDITVDAGNLKINGEEQGSKYKSMSEKEKSIVVQSEYGDVNLQIKE